MRAKKDKEALFGLPCQLNLRTCNLKLVTQDFNLISLGLYITSYILQEFMKKILIIEDEEILLDLLKEKLTQEGYQVDIAKDGQEGLEKAKRDKPDLILLDIIMPRMGGFEVMEELNKDEKFRGIPIIIISSSGQPVELDRAKKLGATDWLIKTDFDPREVVDKVKKQFK